MISDSVLLQSVVKVEIVIKQERQILHVKEEIVSNVTQMIHRVVVQELVPNATPHRLRALEVTVIKRIPLILHAREVIATKTLQPVHVARVVCATNSISSQKLDVAQWSALNTTDAVSKMIRFPTAWFASMVPLSMTPHRTHNLATMTTMRRIVILASLENVSVFQRV